MLIFVGAGEYKLIKRDRVGAAKHVFAAKDWLKGHAAELDGLSKDDRERLTQLGGRLTGLEAACGSAALQVIRGVGFLRLVLVTALVTRLSNDCAALH